MSVVLDRRGVRKFSGECELYQRILQHIIFDIVRYMLIKQYTLYELIWVGGRKGGRGR